jgi:hypothetical protein
MPAAVNENAKSPQRVVQSDKALPVKLGYFLL